MTKVEAANAVAKIGRPCCPKLVLAKAGMLGKNEAYKFHRGYGGHQEDSQTLRAAGYQALKISIFYNSRISVIWHNSCAYF